MTRALVLTCLAFLPLACSAQTPTTASPAAPTAEQPATGEPPHAIDPPVPQTPPAGQQKITYTSTPAEIEAMHAVFDEALDTFGKTFGAEYPMVIAG